MPEGPSVIQVRVDEINHQVLHIGARLDPINHQLDRINHQVVHIEGRLGRVDGALPDLVTASMTVAQLQSAVELLRRRVDETDEALRYMVGEVSQGSQQMLPLVVAIHDELAETAAHLHAIVEDVRAEREATFASNDAAGVRLIDVTQQLALFGRLAALGVEQLETSLGGRTLPDMITMESSIDHARALAEVARSQYRDLMPQDAAPILLSRP
jgi:tetrahydromethanopterin S-methyltransferase subunit G